MSILNRKTKTEAPKAPTLTLTERLALASEDLYDNAQNKDNIAKSLQAQATALTAEAERDIKQRAAIQKAFDILDEAGVTL
jgi:hypothetical protein